MYVCVSVWVLVEYVPTSFWCVFHEGTYFSNTRSVECRLLDAASDTQPTCLNLFHFKFVPHLGVGGLLQGSVWSCISQVSHAGLTIFSCRP